MVLLKFGNAHASAFLSEKRRTMGHYSDGSYSDDKAGRYNAYGEHEDHLPVYENHGQGDIADMIVDTKQDDCLGDYNGYYNQYSANKIYEAPPILPSLYHHDNGNSNSTRDLASYVEHHPVTQARMQKKEFIPTLSSNNKKAVPTSVTFVNASSKPASLTPWTSNGRNAQVRETVLPYTVEEDRDVLLDLKNLGTPAINDDALGEK